MSKIFKIFGGALERLNAYLALHNMRFSAVRETVLEQACTLTQPFTAEQLIHVCEKEHVSSATVYNALKLFVDANIMHIIDQQKGRKTAEYEVLTGEQTRMQIKCEKCGRVANFHDQAIDRIIRGRKYANLELRHYSLFVYGVCKKCKIKKETPKDKILS